MGSFSKFMTKMIGRHIEMPSGLIGWMMVVHVIMILLLITGDATIPGNNHFSRNMSNYTNCVWGRGFSDHIIKGMINRINNSFK